MSLTLGRGDGGETVVTAPGYVLAVDGSRAVLRSRPEHDAEGRDGAGDGRPVVLDLTLLASVHRRDVPHETLLAAPGVEPIGVPEVARVTGGDGDVDAVTVTLDLPTAAWRRKTLHLEARADAVHVRVVVEGDGWITDVTLGGGHVVGGNGSCGELRSPATFASVFSPAVAEPVRVVRPASVPAALGILGDALPGRLHGVFSPPPLAFAFSPDPAPDAPTATPDGSWLGAEVVVDVADAGFTRVLYEPLDGGWWLRLAYEGHTRVRGTWSSPTLRLRPARSVWEVIDDLRAVTSTGSAGSPVAGAPTAPDAPEWWAAPILCGWGSQCARAARDAGAPAADTAVTSVATAPDLARQDLYDAWLARAREHGIVPGTIVVDDRWQAEYGACAVDAEKWPDLRGWIRRQHEDGQRVLLWFKAWDPEGVPARECVLGPDGTPVSVDPSNPDYLARLARIVTDLLSPDGLDADGFKVDFTQRAPSGVSLVTAGDGRDDGGVWGVAALHELLTTLHRAAHRAKPDALVVTHALDPRFADVTDMVRLNDVLERDELGRVVPVVEQLRFRARVARAAHPGRLVDTDQWPMPSRAEWRSYVEEQWRLGVPALYYVEAMDRSDELLDDADLALVADTWRRYGRLRAGGRSGERG
ncbi:MAG: hypothetical protein J0H73_05255 [Salana multivorans]|nr:hypothetical protein [Salana multivorans]